MITGTTGGMLVSPSVAMVEQARRWSQQAREADPWLSDIHKDLGFNYRMSNVVAGIVRGQLEVLDTRVRATPGRLHRYHTRWPPCLA